MNAIIRQGRGLRLILSLNFDRVLYLATVLGALCAGAWIGMLGLS
ncbi:hypothetical protein [Rubellimicrobium sp. CFH 75288]|nr:hypothetical protein [Rubellimicrobium sp. CFH 75288]